MFIFRLVVAKIVYDNLYLRVSEISGSSRFLVKPLTLLRTLRAQQNEKNQVKALKQKRIC